MYDGSTISDNTECTLPGAFSHGGGAVYNAGTFNMKGGVISGNTSEGYGGGVFHYNGIFNMSSGEIKETSLLIRITAEAEYILRLVDLRCPEVK